MSMSTRDQHVEKRKSNKEQNSSNFRATIGYVHVNEQRVYYTGIRGGKQYLVFGIVILLLLVALANLLVFCTAFFCVHVSCFIFILLNDDLTLTLLYLCAE